MGIAKDNNSQWRKQKVTYGSYNNTYSLRFNRNNNSSDKENMKNKGIKKLLIYGKPVLIDYDKQQIIFPDESLTQEELENIAC